MEYKLCLNHMTFSWKTMEAKLFIKSGIYTIKLIVRTFKFQYCRFLSHIYHFIVLGRSFFYIYFIYYVHFFNYLKQDQS